MITRRRWIVLSLGAVVLTSGAATAPSMLRRVDAFDVTRVEVRGTHYMPADAAIAASGINPRTSVFDDYEPYRQRLLKHPMVLDAQIERRLPNTLRVTVKETTPIAFVRMPDLVAVDARMRLLPIDPSATPLDLPVVSRSSRPVIDVLATLKRVDSRLYTWISEAAPASDHGIRLELRNPAGAEIMAPSDSRWLRANEIEVAIADLAARGELTQIKRIDARFHDQIVVALKSGNTNAH